jgi:hypothetical protein
MGVIAGHLVIEALMVELISLKNAEESGWHMNFMQKVDYCIEHGHLRNEMRVAFEMFNSMRNDYAHCLGEYKNEKELSALALECLRNVEGQKIAAADLKAGVLGETREEMLVWCVGSFYYELAEALSNCGEQGFMPY